MLASLGVHCTDCNVAVTDATAEQHLGHHCVATQANPHRVVSTGALRVPLALAQGRGMVDPGSHSSIA